MRILPLAVLGALAACAADAPARSTPAAPAKPAEPPVLPHLFGEKTPVVDGAQLHAYEADSRLVLWLLGREGETSFVVSGGQPITGFAAAPNRAILFDALAARDGIGLARAGGGTRKETLRESDPGISALALLEKIAVAAGATKGVRVSAGTVLPEVSVFARDVKADALVAAIAAATGTKIELAGGQLVVTGTPAQPGPPSGVKAIAESELADATLLATVVDARHRQALLRTSGGPRVALDAAAGLAIEEGRAVAAGRTLAVLPLPPPPQSPKPDSLRQTETLAAAKSASSTEATASATPAAGKKNGTFGVSSDPVTTAADGDAPDGEQDGYVALERQEMQPSRKDIAPAPGSAAWAVEPFREKTGWLGTHEAALARRFRGASWGDAFALALERSLRERGRNAKAVPQKLSDAQIKKLVEEQKLRWIVGGDLKALAVKADKKTATLSIGLNVRKQSGAKLTVVDARTIQAAVVIAGAAPTDEDLLALMRASAEKAADAVVLTIPSDLLAGRN